MLLGAAFHNIVRDFVEIADVRSVIEMIFTPFDVRNVISNKLRFRLLFSVVLSYDYLKLRSRCECCCAGTKAVTGCGLAFYIVPVIGTVGLSS